jgi:hypothetical protein
MTPLVQLYFITPFAPVTVAFAGMGFTLQKSSTAHVAEGSQPNMTRSNHDVRFTPESGL